MDGEGNTRESFQPSFTLWQGQKELVNGWLICSTDEACLGVPWNLCFLPSTHAEGAEKGFMLGQTKSSVRLHVAQVQREFPKWS